MLHRVLDPIGLGLNVNLFAFALSLLLGCFAFEGYKKALRDFDALALTRAGVLAGIVVGIWVGRLL